MPEEIYYVVARLYHKALPKEALPLGISNKNNSPWGYVIKNRFGARACPSENYESLVRDLVIQQVRANPNRSTVTLRLGLENLDFSAEVAESKQSIIDLELGLRGEGPSRFIPSAQRQPEYTDPLKDRFCPG